MAVLVLAEHDNATLSPATLNAVTAGAELGEVTVLIAGEGCHGAAEAAATVAGVAKVLCADDAVYTHPLAENIAALVIGLAADYSHLVAAATTMGKNVMPRIAALLDVAQLSDVMDFAALVV